MRIALLLLSLCAACSMGGSGTGKGDAALADLAQSTGDGSPAGPDGTFPGGDGGDACQTLSDCCPSLPMNFVSDCKGTASTNNQKNCQDFVDTLRMQGYCKT